MPRTADVTVVIPAHQRAAVVTAAIESARRQTVRPAAIIVIDDGSTDGTAEIARDLDVVVLRNATALGSAAARNRGIEAATTDWIAFLDSDDTWAEDHLEVLLANAGGAELVCSAAIDSFGRARGLLGRQARTLTPEDLFFPENLVCTSAVLLRTAVARSLGGFRHVDRAEDLDLWVRVVDRGRAVAVPHISMHYFQPSRYADIALHGRNREGLREVAAAFSTEPWNTARLRFGIGVRERWDEARLALHSARVAQGVVGLVRILATPAALVPLLRVLLFRHRARARGTAASSLFAAPPLT